MPMVHREFVVAQSSFVDGLLGLRELSWRTADATLGWEHPLPVWMWAAIVLGVCVFAGWSYHRLLGPRPVRVMLACLRAALILVVAVLLAGPMLVDPDEREEPDALVMLVDRSASMGIEDVAAEGAAVGSRISRDAALRAALLSQAEVFGDEGLGAGVRQTVWLGFGEQVDELPPLVEASAWDRPQVRADGSATVLREGIEQAIAVGAGRPLASVIVFSDGRTPQSTGADLVQQIARRGTRVHVVPLGPADAGFDLRLQEIEAPLQAFSGDVVPITVRVAATGNRDDLAGGTVTVDLINEATGEVVDTRAVSVDRLGEPVQVQVRSSQVGQVRYRVAVRYEPGASAGGGELVTSNNVQRIVVEMIDRPVRVLYVEGYPRWEYRYLKNMLIREASIDSSMLLLSADQAFAQEGDSPITRPPSNPQEMRPYDVIILGDVPSSYFTPEQLTLIRDHVATSGAGLLWIGGSRDMPASYVDTPLEDLLPMRSVTAVRPATSMVPAWMQPTPLAEALSVLELRSVAPASGDVEGADDADDDWPADLTPLQWVQDVGPLKPTAEVLAKATAGSQAADELPLLVRLRFGAGQSLYEATDETWRWRYGRGEVYFEQYWVQLVRMLARHRVQQSVERARLSVSHRQVDVDAPVVVELTVEDPALLERELTGAAVSVTRSDTGATVDRVQLLPQDGEDEHRRVYRAVWRPTTPGGVTLRVTEAALEPLGLSRPVEVVAPDDEMRQVAPDHARLIALAQATGGEVVPLDELRRLLPAVPNLAEKVAIDTKESLWNSWLAMVVVLGLMSTEWIVRKVIWLV